MPRIFLVYTEKTQNRNREIRKIDGILDNHRNPNRSRNRNRFLSSDVFFTLHSPLNTLHFRLASLRLRKIIKFFLLVPAQELTGSATSSTIGAKGSI